LEPIHHLHWPIGLSATALVALALLARSDAVPVEAPATIAFVGAFSEAHDDSFAGFRSALLRTWPRGAAPPVLRYHQGSDLDPVRLREAVSQAAAEGPTVLVLPTSDGAAVAKSLRLDVPVVFAGYSDPVGRSIVESVRHPGRRTTGVALGDTLDLKRLELLKDAFPRTANVAMLTDNSWDRDVAGLVYAASQHLGLKLSVHVADTVDALDALMRAPESAACDAWYIPPTYIAFLAEAKIIGHLKRLRLPAVHATEEEVAQGALMALSQDTRFAYDAMAELTRRVVNGEDAGSIPVQRPYRLRLSVRVESEPWARIEPHVVRRADRIHRP
jgi:putative ABC transport system substrate-binding protein